MKQKSEFTYPVNYIKVATPCKLIVRLQCGDGIEAARGLAYPTEQGEFIDGQPIERENAKVTLQQVERVFEPMKLSFHLSKEITLLGHAQGRNIQWPRRDIILEESHPSAPLIDTAPQKPNDASSPSITKKNEVQVIETPPVLDFLPIKETSEALGLPSTPEGHEVVEEENQMIELPLTIEEQEVAVEIHCTPKAQKKTTGKRKWQINMGSRDNKAKLEAPKVQIYKEYPEAALVEKYVLGHPWLKPPHRILSLGPWSRRLHDYYMHQCRLPLRERTTLISVEFKREHFHHDYGQCKFCVSFLDLWEFYNYREVETSIIRVFAL
jgi:hypothetical protein